MANPLFELMGNQNPMARMLKQLEDFKRTFSGDPKQQVEQLVASGRVSKEQYDKAVGIANQLQQLIK